MTDIKSLKQAVNQMIYPKTKDGRLDTIKGTIPSQVKKASRMIQDAYNQGKIDLKTRHKLMDCVYPKGAIKRKAIKGEFSKRMANFTLGCSANAAYIEHKKNIKENIVNMHNVHMMNTAGNELNATTNKEWLVQENKLDNTSNEVWLKKGKAYKKRTSNNVSKLVENEHGYVVLYLAIKSVASALIYGDTSVFIKYFNSLNNFPKQIRPYIPIRQSKKLCGISTYILDKETRKNIFKCFKGLDMKVSSNNKDDYYKVLDILLTKYNINDDVIRLLENKTNSNKFNNKENVCNYTFLKCICPEIKPLSVPLNVIEALSEEILTNDEIKNHVLSNPIKEKVMKFGEPQSKYRNGTFGLHGMEYREWHK
ncbi:hypothetical protein GNP73_11235 [Aliivibrio fischeri]|uniref:hypothetical protein n=1 Tax=Aliivibrio fischeri TaxID=668 RepID=UPI0012DA1A6F|nr:hypothetical protein [Aliivibrio fischeri]MUJ28538.1 hypothetical protein [Aliivibrio fischeri]